VIFERDLQNVVIEFDPFSGKGADALEYVWEPRINKFGMAPPFVVCCVSQNHAAHYPSDVLAGRGIGVLLNKAAGRLIRPLQESSAAAIKPGRGATRQLRSQSEPFAAWRVIGGTGKQPSVTTNGGTGTRRGAPSGSGSRKLQRRTKG
jgi:hypothetical protein